MSEHAASIALESIAVGAPLPFSVFSGDNKLLLAKGQIVESERMREHLLRVGRREGEKSARREEVIDDTSGAGLIEDPFAAYVHDFNVAAGQARIGARLSREESSENYPCWVLGADNVHGLIVTAPSKPDRSLLPISEGQTWVFRLLYLTAACKFSGTINKVQFDPTPILHVSPPRQVEMRTIRASPRVATCVRSSIDVGKHVPALISDIGVGGVCIAVERAQTELYKGQQMQVNFCIPMLGVNYNFKVPATVLSVRAEFDKRFPALQFVGARIDAQSEIERLVLHSYVYERTATDFNALWKALMSNKS
jgi:Flagellar protein YcgR/PilZ domain